MAILRDIPVLGMVQYTTTEKKQKEKVQRKIAQYWYNQEGRVYFCFSA